jgi:hypothetical protein
MISKEMAAAGYAAAKKLAEAHGAGWAFSMASTADVYTAVESIYKAMRALEPASSMGTVPPLTLGGNHGISSTDTS